MTNTKWLRRALLGGAALGVMATGAQADELSALKAQLEALQTRVNTLESQPASAAPAGASYVTFERGQGSLANWGNDLKDRAGNNTDSGFTIAITPTADMPAPVAEIVVYGYVKGDVIFDTNGMTNKYSFSLQSLAPAWKDGNDDDYVNLHAFQSRFGIKSKVDTAVGQVRARIEGDFFGKGGQQGGYGDFRLRQAYGEWDMAPGWTLLVGQTDYLENVTNVGIDTVDFYGDAGPLAKTRIPQVRLTWSDGPLTWAVAMEDPTYDSSTVMPNFAGFIGYDIAGGHSIQLTGVVADYDDSTGKWSTPSVGSKLTPVTDAVAVSQSLNGSLNYAQDDLASTPTATTTAKSSDGSGVGWSIMGGASFNLADVATANIGAAYGQGEIVRSLNQTASSNQRVDVDGDLMEAWAIQGGLSFGINETTTFNVGAGYEDYLGSLTTNWIDSAVTVHANIMWQPVKQMKLGWEVMWGQIDYAGEGYCTGTTLSGEGDDATASWSGCKDSFNDVRLQFGAWFFF